MAWNEPGGGNRDPWGGRNPQQGPPDLDEVLRNLQNRLNGIFGGGRGGGGSGGSSAPTDKLLVALLVLVAIVWLASGIYIVGPSERGVVTQFGAYQTTTSPGPHWHIPFPVQSVEKVNIDRVRSAQHQALMLTRDENIVDIELAVQYRVSNAEDYLFNVRNPDATLANISRSAIREVVGKNEMDFVLTEGRSVVVNRSQEVLQEVLESYETGLIINSVNLQQAQPPEEVQAAFEDAIKAREDEQRFINEAEAYRNEIIPRARGNAQEAIEQAKGYRARVIDRASGDAERFSQLLGAYQVAPEVTRERLYIETMEQVLSASTKVMIDSSSNSNLLMLPLDQLIRRAGSSSGSGASDNSSSSASRSNSSNSLDALRTRGGDMRSREVR